jgi:uncharacterized membrane protein HdeD (DUF308 family)
MRRQALPPPTQFTWGDKIRLVYGALVLLLGIAILWRTLPLGVTLQAIVIGVAFIAFGIYRLWLGYTRLKEWNKRGGTQ